MLKEKCPKCNGTGHINCAVTYAGKKDHPKDCQGGCGGTGKVSSCSPCNGSGVIEHKDN